MRPVRLGQAAAIAAAAALMAGCATKGYVREQIREERMARMQVDSALATDIAAVRSDQAQLRAELQQLRTEFNTRITAMEDGLRFAVPVHFGFDEATVRPEDEAALQRFAQVASRYYPNSLITVEGFADPAGSAAYNRVLSERRAEAVREYLLAQGLSAEQVRAIGYGETRQVAPGAARDEPGAMENRRVVFVVESASPATVAELEPAGDY